MSTKTTKKTVSKKSPAKKAAAKKVTAKKSAVASRLLPPPGGATVRMYRTGHGDCFLIAFAGEDDGKPAYVLIDCGYKPGSPKFINTTIKEITANIKEATGGHLDVAVITHEHQDHVNGISAKNFEGITIGQAWFAWTEDPQDKDANDLRKKFKDKLLGLMAARNQLAAAPGAEQRLKDIDDLLAFELGGEDEKFDPRSAAAMLGTAAKDPLDSMNKKSMKVFKDLATEDCIRYLEPHDGVLTVPGSANARVFVLGPPRDVSLLSTLDPEGDEEFNGHGLARSSASHYFAAAARGAEHGGDDGRKPPFANRYCVPWKKATASAGGFFTSYYGSAKSPSKQGWVPNAWEEEGTRRDEVDSNAPWRRIDNDWLYASSQLALDMNDQTNNSSLVLAFELGKGGKVLLFAADAQRGNWLSWAKKDWRDGTKRVKARDLLGRTVLYKAGHHCSHNATLNGKPTAEYANLSWIAEGEYAGEFTAMITAVRAWAETQKGWNHPFKPIKDELIRKARGRVFQTDTDVDQIPVPAGVSKHEWAEFLSRTHGDRLYFDFSINP